MLRDLGLVLALLTCLMARTLPADEPASDKPGDKPAARTETKDGDQEELFRDFEKRLNGVKLVGQYTVTGKETAGAKEEYTIHNVSKMPQGDYWLFNARIKYGQHDVTVPIPLQVKWAGKTPVLTLDELTIPGLGTFSARVVIDKDKYAGTWSHGPAGGHLFGAIEKAEAKE